MRLIDLGNHRPPLQMRQSHPKSITETEVEPTLHPSSVHTKKEERKPAERKLCSVETKKGNRFKRYYKKISIILDIRYLDIWIILDIFRLFGLYFQ